MKHVMNYLTNLTQGVLNWVKQILRYNEKKLACVTSPRGSEEAVELF